MTLRIHTSQLNVGKRLKKSNNVYFLDVTIKSGDEALKHMVAPTWELLRARKDYDKHLEAGDLDTLHVVMDDTCYSSEYLLSLSRITTEFDAFIRSLIKDGYTDLVLGCYCGAGKFCHRYLLQCYIVTHYDCTELGWEITSDDVSIVKIPNRMILSMNVTDDVRKAIVETYGDSTDCEVICNPYTRFKRLPTISACGDTDSEACRLESAIRMYNYVELIDVHILRHRKFAIDLSDIITSGRDTDSLRGVKLYRPSTMDDVVNIVDNVGYVERTHINKSLDITKHVEYMTSLYESCKG